MALSEVMDPTFEQIINQNIGRLRYIAKRYANDFDAEDVLQEILMQLWRSFESFKGDSSISTWMYRIALNTSISMVRKSVKQSKLQIQLQGIMSYEIQPGPESCQAEILENFMESLKDIDANILMMYLDGLSSQSISDVTGMASNTVSVRISRIKKLFESKYIGNES